MFSKILHFFQTRRLTAEINAAPVGSAELLLARGISAAPVATARALGRVIDPQKREALVRRMITLFTQKPPDKPASRQFIAELLRQKAVPAERLKTPLLGRNGDLIRQAFRDAGLDSRLLML